MKVSNDETKDVKYYGTTIKHTPVTSSLHFYKTEKFVIAFKSEICYTIFSTETTCNNVLYRPVTANFNVVASPDNRLHVN